jgi:hypothetical protein
MKVLPPFLMAGAKAQRSPVPFRPTAQLSEGERRLAITDLGRSDLAHPLTRRDAVLSWGERQLRSVSQQFRRRGKKEMAAVLVPIGIKSQRPSHLMHSNQA